jgi:hypothetical protein
MVGGAGATLPPFEGSLRRAIKPRRPSTDKQTLPFGPLDYRVVPPDVK